MIAKDSGTGKSFAGLVNYLENGKRGEQQDRVAWFTTENLDVVSMREAALTMRDVANQNSRVEAPVYHFSINWHADESGQVDQEMAMGIARDAIEDLGLQNHQALIVAHKDTDHFHVHVVANRIDPDSHKAWTGSFSKVKLEQSMARLSMEHGFEVVPGYHNSLDLGIDPPAPENSQSTEALRFEERTDTPSFDTTVRIELAEVFEKAETWRELKAELSERGYGLEARGRGLVVSGEEGQYAKASAIGREFSKSQLEQRFGEPFAAADPEIGSDIMSPADERKALSQSLKGAADWREFTEAAESFGYEAKAKGRGLVLVSKGREVKSSDVDRSLSRGRLENKFGETFTEFERSDSRAIARRQVEAAEKLERAMTAFENFERVEEHATDLFVQRQEVLARTEDSFQKVQRVRAARDRIDKIAGDVYQRPETALRSFDAERKKIGTRAAIQKLADNPKAYGKTASRGLFGVGDAAFKDATAGLRLAGDEYVAAVAELSKGRDAIDADLKERFDKSATETLKSAQQALKKVDRGQLAQDLLKASDGIKPGELKELPFRTRLRAAAVSEKIAELKGQGKAVGREPSKWPRLPLDATPAEARGFDAAERYAKARHAIRNAAPWRSPQAEASRGMFNELRDAARGLTAEGKGAGRYYSRFSIDKRTLQADTFAGAKGGAAERKNDKMSALLNSKSPKIRIRFTSILRMLGVPVPRIPVPRVPRMPVQSKGKGMIRELTR